MSELSDEDVGLTQQVSPQSPQPQTQQPRDLGPLGPMMAFGEGVTFGWADELAKLLAPAFRPLEQAIPLPRNPEVPSLETLAKTGELGAARQQFTEENPLAAAGLEVSGMISNPASRAGGKFTAAHPVIGGGLSGLGFGMLSGAGKNPEDRIMGMLMGGGIGLPFGMASGYLSGKLMELLKPNTRGVAPKVIRGELSKTFPDDQAAVQALRETGPQGRIIDMGPTGQGLGVGVSLKSPGAAQKIVDYVDDRALGTKGRLMNFMKNQFGMKGNDFSGFLRNTIAERARQSAPLYDKSRKQLIPQNVMAQFDDYLANIPKTEKLSGIPEVNGVIRQLRNSLKVDGKFKTSVDAIETARKRFGAKIFNLKSKVGKDVYDQLVSVRNQFDDLMPDEYVQANKIFSSESSVIDSFKEGTKFFTTDIDDIADMVSNKSQADLDGYLSGIGKAIVKKIGKKTPKGKLPRALETDEVIDKLRVVLGDKADDFISQIENEGIYSATRQAITSGSHTARLQAAQQRVTGAMLDSGGVPTSARETADMLIRNSIGRLGGMSEKNLQKMAEILVDDLGEDGLRALLKQPGGIEGMAGPASGFIPQMLKEQEAQ